MIADAGARDTQIAASTWERLLAMTVFASFWCSITITITNYDYEHGYCWAISRHCFAAVVMVSKSLASTGAGLTRLLPMGMAAAPARK